VAVPGALGFDLAPLQSKRGPNGSDIAVSLGGSAIGSFLRTVLLGVIFVALAPGSVEWMMAVVDEPVETSVCGLLALVVIVALTVFLVIRIVGIVLVIPLVLVAWLECDRRRHRLSRHPGPARRPRRRVVARAVLAAGSTVAWRSRASVGSCLSPSPPASGRFCATGSGEVAR